MSDRNDMIVRLLRIHQYMTVPALCEALDASPATVRRALSQLDEQGQLQYVNGGALLLKPELGTHPEMHKQKLRIARAALAYIHQGDTLFIDAGSTNNVLADALIEFSGIQVVTNSIYIAYRLFSANADISVCVCGGNIGGSSGGIGSVVGVLAESLVQHVRANVFFMGCSAVHPSYGITDPNIQVASLKQQMHQNAQQTILLCDHTKLDQVHMAFVAPLSALDRMITDTQAEPERIRALEENGLTVELV